MSAFGIASTVEMGWLQLIMYDVISRELHRCQFANMADNTVAFLKFSSLPSALDKSVLVGSHPDTLCKLV